MGMLRAFTPSMFVPFLTRLSYCLRLFDPVFVKYTD